MSNVATIERKKDRVASPTSPAEMIKALSPEDKKTIMSICMPPGATDSDLAIYLHRCYELGFDPFGGDLVLQKYQTKTGVRINFITTRDALLKVAERNPDYDGINSGVVKEGDTFAVDTEKGIVKHQFGAKRGNILVGWAVAYHKTRKPIVFTADYREYAMANGKSPVWGSVPSTMIQKVAEVGALRRQFPAGGQIYTAEEMQLAEDTPTPQEETTVDVVVEKEKSTEQTVDAPKKPVAEQPPEPVAETTEPVTPKDIPPSEEAEDVPPKAEPSEPPQEKTYTLVGIQTGKSGSGTPFAKIFAEVNGQEKLLLAKDEEGLAEAAKLKEGCSFDAETYEEAGFQFIKTIEI